MTKSTRYFVFVAVIILVAGLGTGLVAYFMGFRASAFARRTGPDELQYVPRDVAVVAFANVRDVMNSQLRQKIRNLEPSEEGRHDFEEKTGINIETDVDHVVACLGGPNVPSHTGSDEMDGGLVLATGRFNEFKIENLMREHGGRIEEYKGKRLVTHPGDNLPGHEGEAGPAYRRRHPEGLAVAFIEPTTVAVGSIPMVKQAIDARAGGQNIMSNEELMGLVRGLESGNAWAVGRFDALASRARLPENVADKLPPIAWFSATGHVNGGLSGVVRAEARDAESAQNLRDVLRGFMALAKLQAGSKPEMQAMMQSLELSGTGKTVAISFAVPAEIFDAIPPRPQSPDHTPMLDELHPRPPAPPRPPVPPKAPPRDDDRPLE